MSGNSEWFFRVPDATARAYVPTDVHLRGPFKTLLGRSVSQAHASAIPHLYHYIMPKREAGKLPNICIFTVSQYNTVQDKIDCTKYYNLLSIRGIAPKFTIYSHPIFIYLKLFKEFYPPCQSFHSQVEIQTLFSSVLVQHSILYTTWGFPNLQGTFGGLHLTKYFPTL